MRFHGGGKVYPTEVRNKKNALPVHIAAMSNRCPQRVLQMLYQVNKITIYFHALNCTKFFYEEIVYCETH